MADPLPNLHEYLTKEELPLSAIFDVVLDFLIDRSDVVLFGAHAVNVYVDVPRATGDVDVLSTNAPLLAEEIRERLARDFKAAVRILETASGRGFRVYQERVPKNRHLVDVRQVSQLPAHKIVEGVSVVEPVTLVAMKIVSYDARQMQAKGGTDLADLRRLLIAMPDLQAHPERVHAALEELDARESSFSVWNDLAATQVEPDEDDY